LGIFGVNMPPLYGEGPNAFFRLQLEKMRISNDESLFVWENELVTSQSVTSGLLAPSPISFRYSYDIISLAPPWVERPPYSMTNKGLEISLQLCERDTSCPHPPWRTWKAPLNWAREGYDKGRILSIVLDQDGTGTDSYRRVDSSRLPSFELEPQVNNGSARKELQVIYVKQPQIYSGTRSYCYFRIDPSSLRDAGWEINDRVVLSSELGRWGSDSLGYLQLKLSNSSACVKILRRRKPSLYEPDDDEKLEDVFLLTVSCFGKRGKAVLNMFELKGDYFPMHYMFKTLNKAWNAWNSKEIISNKTETLRGTFESGRSVKVSLWKERRSGGRELFAIKLEED
jgi:hypothetical protein